MAQPRYGSASAAYNTEKRSTTWPPRVIETGRKLRELVSVIRAGQGGYRIESVAWMREPSHNGLIHRRCNGIFRKSSRSVTTTRGKSVRSKSRISNVGTAWGAPEWSAADVMKLQLRVNESTGIIRRRQVQDFRAEGKPPSPASSMANEWGKARPSTKPWRSRTPRSSTELAEPAAGEDSLLGSAKTPSRPRSETIRKAVSDAPGIGSKRW